MMTRAEKIAALKSFFDGNIKSLFQKSLVIITGKDGSKIDPGTGKPYTAAELGHAENTVEIPMNGRESFTE